MRKFNRHKKRVGLIYCPDYLIVRDMFFPPYALSVYRRQLSDAGYVVENIDLSFLILRNPALYKLHSHICTNLENDLNDIGHEDNRELYSTVCSDAHMRMLIDVILKELDQYDLDYHCFSIMHAPLMYTFAIIAAIKRKFGKPVIVGGQAIRRPWTKAEAILRFCPEIDYLLSGPRAETFLHVLDVLSNKNVNIGKPMPGLAYMDGKEFEYYPPNRAEFQKLPLWHHLKPAFNNAYLEQYKYGKREFRKILSEQPIRWEKLPRIKSKICVVADQFFSGCKHSCIFCPLSDKPLEDLREPRVMARRLIELYDEYGIDYFFLMNSQINPTKKYAEHFCGELLIHNRPIHFSDSGNFCDIDACLLDKLKSAGCVLLWWGSEIISDRMLKYLGKRLTVKKICDGVRLSHDAGIFNCLNFIVGMPYETTEDIEATKQFMLEYKDCIDGVQLNTFELRGGLIEKYQKKYGIRILNVEGGRVFDEIKGLEWQDKLKQTRDHMAILQAAVNHEMNRFSRMSLNIFYLNKIVGDEKRRMKAIMRDILPGDPYKVPY